MAATRCARRCGRQRAASSWRCCCSKATASPRPPQGGGAALLTQYTIQPADVAGPFEPRIPSDFAEMARLPHLSYRSPAQLLAEKFHVSQELLNALNPGQDFAQAGTVINIPEIA